MPPCPNHHIVQRWPGNLQAIKNKCIWKIIFSNAFFSPQARYYKLLKCLNVLILLTITLCKITSMKYCKTIFFREEKEKQQNSREMGKWVHLLNSHKCTYDASTKIVSSFLFKKRRSYFSHFCALSKLSHYSVL